MLKFNWRKSKENTSKLRLGATVRVKCGTEDPDYKGLDISDYTGTIKQIDDENHLILIELDSVTLEKIDKNFIRKITEDGFDYQEIWLEKDEVIEVKGINKHNDEK